MEFIPIAHQDNYEQLLKHINAYKNGVTSDAMQSYGIAYEQNFGVSVIDLRRVANRFTPNQELASLLWKKGWRETYILSTLLDEEKHYTEALLKQRFEEAPTFEVLEQLAYNLAWKLPFADHFFETVEQQDNEKTQYFMLKCTTYQLMNKSITALQAWNRIKRYHFIDQAAILNILQNLMLRITATDNGLQQEVVTFCSKNEGERWQTLRQIIQDYGVL